MAENVRIAFEQEIILLDLSVILPTRVLSEKVKQTVKYRRILSSVAQIGLIEPLCVARQKNGQYLLLDGHVRLDALRQKNDPQARCIVANDDEGFTHNKRINRLPAIQEHYMIVRALDRGVPQEKLAAWLDVDVRIIQLRRNLLAGISADVAELLKDRPVGHMVFQKLRKMKPIRQLEVAELMMSANNYTSSYVKALLATTKPDDLHRPEELRKETGLSTEQMARLEREMSVLSETYKEMEMSYGDDMLVLVVAAGYLERLVSKPEIEHFLMKHYPEFLDNFRSIVSAASLDQTASGA